MKSIVVGGTRVLRPSEYKEFIKHIPNVDHRTFFKALLFSGMRYVELQRLQENKGWFDGDFIHLPQVAMRKAKRKQLERWIRLNPLGKEVITNFLVVERKLPSIQSWNMNLKRWGNSINNGGVSPKTTRKTWESWLCFFYPEHLANIVLSQGHTTTTAIQHYINMPFTSGDREEMKEFVVGWI